MPVPSPRNKILPARGNFSDLSTNVASLLDGEICYAIDQDQYYQNEGGTLVSVGATKAQGLLADSAIQPGDNVSDLTNDAGYITLAEVPGDLVTSVAGKTGDVTLVKADVGLGNVDNTSDVNKPISTATQTALDAKADLVGGFVPTSQIPAIAITEFLGSVASEAAMLALTGQPGDWCLRTDKAVGYVIVDTDPSVIAGWEAFTVPGSAVTSINTQVGDVVLSASDVGAVSSVNGQTGIVTLDADDINDDFTTHKFATAAQLAKADNALLQGASLNELSDVVLSGPANDEILRYNGTTWVNEAVTTDDISEGTVNLYSQWDAATGGINYAGGNVGIGTSNPGANLDIYASALPTLRLTDSAGGYGSFTYNESGTVSTLTIEADPGNTSVPTTSMRFTVDGSERLLINSNGNVGIGTSNPLYKLTTETGSKMLFGSNVDDNGDPSLYLNRWQGSAENYKSTKITSDIGGELTFSRATAGATDISLQSYSESMRIDSNGNVGIGTSSPSKKLTIRSGASDQLRIEDNVGDGIDLVRDTTTGFLDFNGTQETFSGFSFSTTPTAGSLTEQLTILNNGNVGIGTSNPALKLSVSGSGAEITRITRTDAGAKVQIGFASTGTTIRPAIGAEDNDLTAEVGATEKMRITSSGNVGIGTSSPVGKLNLVYGGTIPSVTEDTADGIILSAGGVQVAFGVDTGSPYGGFIQARDNTNLARPVNLNPVGGNVGVGTRNPGRELHVVGANNVIRAESTGTAARIEFENSNTTAVDAVSLGSVTDDMQFVAGSAERMRIAASGNVGIGTSSPAGKLHVSSASVGFNANADADELFISNTDNSGVTIACGTNKKNSIYFAEQGVGVSRGAIVYDTNNDSLAFSTNALVNERMRISSSGNVGIGTTSPGALLSTQGSKDYTGTTPNSGSYDVSFVSGTAGLGLGQSNGVPSIQGFGTGTSYNIALCPNNGSVGIGTTSPSASLEISNSNPTFALTDTGNANTTFRARNASGTVFLDSKFNNGNGVIAFTRNGESVESARIDSDGNVGIGTSAPETKLQINGPVVGASATYPGDLQINANPLSLEQNGGIEFKTSGFGSGYGWKISSVDPGDGVDLRIGTRQNSATWSDVVTLDAVGNVGIGTSSPSAPLEIKTPAGTDAAIRLNESTTTNPLLIEQSSTEARIQTLASQPLVLAGQSGEGSTSFIKLETRANERMRIDSNGNVGIGTSDPGTELEVVATSPTIQARATGNNTAKLSLDSNRAASVLNGQIEGRWNGNAVSRIDFVNGADSVNKDDGLITFSTSSSGSNPQERMRIDSRGRININTRRQKHRR
ncbi:chaperone of endosialidase [Synechococcus phage S-CRES1]|nr:chaperone of endosialidase [Synechococcus phage S-CRES1]